MFRTGKATSFAFLAAPRRPETHLLIRAAQPRAVRIAGDPPTSGTLFAAAAAAPVVGQLTVSVPARRVRQARESREGREAKLTLQAIRLQVQPPSRTLPGEPRTPQWVWVVRAVEEQAPPGETPIEWVLISTLPPREGGNPIHADPATLVRYYALRWRIERLHFTLKSGCQVEDLQHDTATSLKKALGLYYVVAWRLLHLTYLARVQPELPPTEHLETSELAVLQQIRRRPAQTIREAVQAIAELAGWRGYRSAPDPGVKMLWLGLQRLEDLARGWRLALGLPTKRYKHSPGEGGLLDDGRTSP